MTYNEACLNLNNFHVKHYVTDFIQDCAEALGHLAGFATLLEHAKHIKKFTNDAFAKHILTGHYGDPIAIVFRNWVRARIEEAKQGFLLKHPECVEEFENDGTESDAEELA